MCDQRQLPNMLAAGKFGGRQAAGRNVPEGPLLRIEQQRHIRQQWQQLVAKQASEGEILRRMKSIVGSPDALSGIGRESNDWVAYRHSPECVRTAMEPVQA